jgi:hypothetical protein
MMAVLYTFSSAYSYAYATIVTVLGGIIVIYFAGKNSKRMFR